MSNSVSVKYPTYGVFNKDTFIVTLDISGIISNIDELSDKNINDVKKEFIKDLKLSLNMESIDLYYSFNEKTDRFKPLEFPLIGEITWGHLKEKPPGKVILTFKLDNFPEEVDLEKQTMENISLPCVPLYVICSSKRLHLLGVNVYKE